MAEVLLRPFELADIDAFAKIEEELMPPELRFSKQKMADMLTRDDVVAFSLVDQETVIGYSILRSEVFKRQFIIIELNITSDYQRQGIGTNILYFIEKTALNIGATQLVCQVVKNNTPACQFFLKHGFIISAQLKDFLLPDQTGYELIKHLTTDEAQKDEAQKDTNQDPTDKPPKKPIEK